MCFDLISIGQIALDIVGKTDLWELRPGTSVRLRSIRYMLGGAASNFAISAKIYGGKEVAVVSKVGSGILSSAMIRRLRELGIGTLVEIVDGPPHLVVSVVRPNGERTLIGAMNENLLLSDEDVKRQLAFLTSDCVRSVHISYVEPSIALKMLKAIWEGGGDVVVTYKPGIYVKELKDVAIGDLPLGIELVQCNSAEARFLDPNRFENMLLEHENGFSLYNGGKEISRAALLPEDRTGSGDIFTGLLVSKFLDHHDWTAAFEETAEVLRKADSPWLLNERLLFT